MEWSSRVYCGEIATDYLEALTIASATIAFVGLERIFANSADGIPERHMYWTVLPSTRSSVNDEPSSLH